MIFVHPTTVLPFHTELSIRFVSQPQDVVHNLEAEEFDRAERNLKTEAGQNSLITKTFPCTRERQFAEGPSNHMSF
jgi:hypothetical protein